VSFVVAFYLSVLKALIEVALLALAGQLLVGIFNWNRRHENFVYQLLGIIAKPVVKFVRLVTPRVVLDRHIPIAAFLLLVFAWLGAGLWKINACSADMTQASCEDLAKTRQGDKP
jgi:hypothetical protein